MTRKRNSLAALPAIIIAVQILAATGCSLFEPAPETILIRDTIYYDPETGAQRNKPLNPMADKSEPKLLRLDNQGDSAVLHVNMIGYLECNIDTNKNTIVSNIDTENNKITFKVEPKNKPVALKSICDIVQTPASNAPQIVDEYNLDRKGLPYKIILVPLFDDDCNHVGYQIRYDTEGRIGLSCDNHALVVEANRRLKECQKYIRKNDSNIQIPKSRIDKSKDCLEWKMFRIPCNKSK